MSILLIDVIITIIGNNNVENNYLDLLSTNRFSYFIEI